MPFEPINNSSIRPIISSDLEPSQPYVEPPTGHQHGESGWQYFWKELWNRLSDFGEQSQVGNNATAQAGIDMAANGTGYGQGLQDVVNAVNGVPDNLDHIDMSSIGGSNITNSGGTSGKTAGQYNLDSILGNSAYQASGALQAYYDLFQQTGNEAYLEKIVDSLYQLETTQSARDWDKMMSDTQYSRAFEDIKNSGYNPWMLLQSGSSNGASYGGTSSAKGSSTGASSQETSEENNKRNNRTDTANTLMRSLLLFAIFALRAI